MARTIHGRSEERLAYWAMVLPAVLLYLLVLGFPDRHLHHPLG